ncbi:hypothetical protein BH23ACT11_BH23ACT11_10260 [soil metagenome]
MRVMTGKAAEAGIAGYETAQQVAGRLGIDPSQVRRYCEQGRIEGAFKPHARMWLVPRGAVPAEAEVRRRPPGWAPPRTVGQIYNIPEGSWRSITPEEARTVELYAAAPGHEGVTADVINLAPGMAAVADELFSFRYVGDRRTPLPAALFMGKGYAGAVVVVYEYDLEGHRSDFRTLTATKDLLAEGEAQTERLRRAR